MLLRFLMNLEPVHRARTDDEREAIYRFRYQVYIVELKYPYEDADHERRWLKQAEDEDPHTTLFYTGTPDRVTSTVRVRTWGPGEVPAATFRSMSLDLFPGIEALHVIPLLLPISDSEDHEQAQGVARDLPQLLQGDGPGLLHVGSMDEQDT